MNDQIRHVVFDPYLSGEPKSTLKLFDSAKKDSYGKWILGYEFYQDQELIFIGSDFHCSPLHSIDSDDTIQELMGFLTLQPGDTDAEYFENYSPRQMKFAIEHGETLACYGMEGYNMIGMIDMDE
jgi:hypothetical protein